MGTEHREHRAPWVPLCLLYRQALSTLGALAQAVPAPEVLGWVCTLGAEVSTVWGMAEDGAAPDGNRGGKRALGAT